MALHRGSAVIYILIEAFILIIIAGVSIRLLSNVYKGTRGISTRQDRESIRKMILDEMNCRATLNPSGLSVLPAIPPVCTSGPIALNRANSTQILISGSKVGPWTVNVTCEPTGTPTYLKITLTQPGVSDSVTNLPFDSSHPKAQLFGSLDRASCPTLFGGVSSCSDCDPSHQKMVGIQENGCPKCGEVFRPIVCTKNYFCPFSSGTAQYYYEFEAADCTGGALPDETYIGLLSGTSVGCLSHSWEIRQPAAGVNAALLWRCANNMTSCPPAASLGPTIISAVFIKRTGI